jgi:hypothetical protein
LEIAGQLLPGADLSIKHRWEALKALCCMRTHTYPNTIKAQQLYYQNYALAITVNETDN